jgi:trk system potassium uptake protein
MVRFIASLPFFVLMMGIGSAAMLIPAAHALSRSDFFTARTFFYGAILGLVLTLLIGIATRGVRPKSVPRSQLTALLAAFTVLPVLFAVPFYETLRTASFVDAWFEMVSSFTTTGATLYDNPARLNLSLHLWRATVGWLGGLLVWVMAVAILAPMNLGGFEVRAGMTSASAGQYRQISRITDPSERITRFGWRLVPIYTGLTLVLWVGLMLAGQAPVVALSHAMATLSTSGISPIGGLERVQDGFWGELLIFGFLFFAVSRLTFSRGLLGHEPGRLWRDPEMQMALIIITLVPLFLFVRHFFGAREESLAEAASALWGGLFTVLSFLTTTGFESRQWLGAQDWSGLRSPGLILVGVALVGGGVATTAGGVKLLRIYALYKHGEREVQRLIHPASVGGAGAEARHIRRGGAQISFIFFMLFALSVAAVMIMLSFTGVQFETAMVLTVAALSTTGPLATVAAENPISYAGISDGARMILAATMVLGRLETLALIALFNPDFWRS